MYSQLYISGACDRGSEAESVRTLALQGGPMTPAEVTGFEALPFSGDAVAVRRWDDQAKDPAVTPPRFAHFAALPEALVGV